MIKHLKIFNCYFKLNLASSLEYRASFITQIFGMALSNSSFILFWWITFSQIGGEIAGYQFKDVLFIWAITSTGFGLGQILFANASNLTKLIVTGEFDAFLLQPCNVLLNLLCSRTRLSAYGDFIYGLIIMCLFYTDNMSAWLWFICGAFICAVLLTAVTLTAHTLSFYWGDASMIGQFATEFIINFSIYPEKIYGPFVRVLMYSIIPAGIAVHIPLQLFHAFALPKLLMALVGVALYCFLAGAFFYRGIRRYESGNTIVTRL
ncbi:ABC-2 family transporter protein [Paenibacillus sp. FSL H7-0350]|uniref:ABC transporter permease n=1 Tax=Paenibacillus sp. FSL H7-0350 TaxID=2975345 RepID=UPI0031584D2E